MAKLSLRKAAEVFEVSRPTLSKALKNGTISGEKDTQGQWRVDTAELSRVYNPRTSEQVESTGGLSTANRGLPDNLDVPDNPETAELRRQLAEAEKRAAVAEAQAEEKERFIEELRKDKAELRRLLPAPDETKRKGWWPW